MIIPSCIRAPLASAPAFCVQSGTPLRAAALLIAAAIAGAAAETAPASAAGTGAPVTVIDHGDGTVTMSNGIASLVAVKKTGRLNSLKYTYEHAGAVTTTETLLGNGQYYYGGFSLGSGEFVYDLATDPAANGGDYGDLRLLSTSPTNGVMEIHFSMLRGSPGFYSTASMTHRPQDEAFEVGAWGVVTRVPRAFNWVSADARRDFFIGVPGSKGVKVPDSPHEITVNLDGSQQGTYADKFIYSQDHADLEAWGWSSVGKEGLNVGRWMMTTMEFSNGGPLKRDVSVYPYSELNNSILTGEVGMGSDGYMDKGEVWTKTCGPWFTYLNHVPATITDPKEAAHRLFADARARAAAEAKAWPYAWFTHAGFVPPSGRGTVSGRIAIADPGAPGASAQGLWVGLQIQPQTHKGFYDFQKWSKTYQFWVRTAADGSFTIPDVIAGTGYTLWAFGPGAAGTFLSHPLEGGAPPFECDLPEAPFLVAVAAGRTTQLDTVRWVPKRVGATVFELGVANRKADEFRHGEDYWNPGTPPKLGFPTPVWGGQMEFPVDFPEGLTYEVGTSQWPRDWNYVLPAMADASGKFQPCSGTIAFTLAQAPAAGAQASLYLALAGNDGDHVRLAVNDTDLGGASGVVAAPDALGPDGFKPPYSDTSSIHFSDHGPFCDERVTFPAALLKAGRNTLRITMDTRTMVAYLMVDYLRLELTGYVPAPPASVGVSAGNGRVAVTWPPVPGATSYQVLRSIGGNPAVAIATDVTGPVCGSGTGPATFIDATAANGSTCTYTVRACNPAGQSAPSVASREAKPLATLAGDPPAAPAGLAVTASGHHRVALRWDADPGATGFRVWRTTMHTDGVGGTYPLRTILIDTTTATESVDASPSDGRIYAYQVTALNAAGAGQASAAVTAIPLPAAPTAAPAQLVGAWTKTREGPVISLSWSAVPGATGYVIYRTTKPGAPFTWPADFLTALAETTYLDRGVTDKNAKVKGLDPTGDYSYQVTAVNAGGVSTPATVHVGVR
jgi:rhamnogalacturonan endolyase